MQKLTDEQQRLLNWLKAGAGSQPKISVDGLFSHSTIKSLLRTGLIIDDWCNGYYTAKEILKTHSWPDKQEIEQR